MIAFTGKLNEVSEELRRFGLMAQPHEITGMVKINESDPMASPYAFVMGISLPEENDFSFLIYSKNCGHVAYWEEGESHSYQVSVSALECFGTQQWRHVVPLKVYFHFYLPAPVTEFSDLTQVSQVEFLLYGQGGHLRGEIQPKSLLGEVPAALREAPQGMVLSS